MDFARGDAVVRQDVLTVALVIPRSGPAGIFGLSSELSATLAMEELNAADGAGGRKIRLLPVDGGGLFRAHRDPPLGRSSIPLS